ncbi:acetoacetate decarboxylase family protein [Xanthobacter autotrophicus]|uniref:acetoacetate decarboxylase family protein n=1 Tax=Xanthobacter autotrophicus TaxID=280 RepID=UPI0037270E53
MSPASKPGDTRGQLYPPPPWSYIGARVLNVVCRAKAPQAVHGLIPAPLRAAREDGLFILWFLSVPSILELGPHYRSTEGGICIPARTADGAAAGSTFATMVVDNDVALIGGREIWGYPKQMGTVGFDTCHDPRTVDVSIHHPLYRDGRGDLIVSATALLDGTGDAVLAILPTLEPRLLKRTIPGPFHAGVESEAILQVTTHSQVVHERCTGAAAVTFGPGMAWISDPGPIEVLGAVFSRCDFILPYAQPIQSTRS